MNFKSLEEVICHEIAHSEKFRHCKTHTKRTEELLQKVQEYQKDSNKDFASCLDSKITRAKREQVPAGAGNTKKKVPVR